MGRLLRMPPVKPYAAVANVSKIQQVDGCVRLRSAGMLVEVQLDMQFVREGVSRPPLAFARVQSDRGLTIRKQAFLLGGVCLS
jgi:hypothetical protein